MFKVNYTLHYTTKIKLKHERTKQFPFGKEGRGAFGE